MLITILMFFFLKVLSPMFSGQNWSQNLKFRRGVYCCILITIFMFIFFFQKFSHSYNFEKIWSQNLKFSKFTEIWCRGILLYAYYNCNVCFIKSFVIHIVFDKFGHKIWFVPVDQNLVFVYIVSIICWL